MKKTMLPMAILGLITVGLMQVTAQTNTHQPQKTKTMETVKQSKETVQGFFNAFGNGDFNGIMNSFHDSCSITAIRNSKRNAAEIYGSYHGKEGLKTFLTNLGNTFDTKAFTVDHLISEGNIAFANGKFTHVVKPTGNTFKSDWALMCVIKDDKIFEYHFFEDSALFVEASK